MFVACDEDGNVLKEPKITEIANFQKPNKSFEDFQLEYQKALDNVIFKGFKYHKNEFCYMYTDMDQFKIDEEYMLGKSIKSLLCVEIQLTQSAITKYQI